MTPTKKAAPGMGTALGNAIDKAKHIINAVRWSTDATLAALTTMLIVIAALALAGCVS